MVPKWKDEKLNILIPMAGEGKRFLDAGYTMPKPLISVNGKPMIYRVIENLKLNIDEDKLYIIYHNHLKEFNFETLIRFWFPKIDISFISLDYLTKGASETVLRGLETIDDDKLSENFLILDCDTFYVENIIDRYKKSDNKNVIFYFKDTNINPIYSYIKLNGDIVSDIKEKVKISDNANTGAYGFESGKMLKQYCSKVLKLNGELFTSRVYGEMLIDGKIVNGLEVKEFHCVGTPLQLTVYCNKNKEKANNLRVCFDLDNTLVTHPTIAGDYTSVLPIERNIEFLKLLHRLGNTIIIYTARRMKTHNGNVGAIVADVGKITLDTLDKFGIPYNEIHFGKPYANFYIDDLAVNANTSLDKALGIYDIDTPPRSFNKVEYNNKTVTKYTSNDGEVYWYNHIPSAIEHYFPKVIAAKGMEIVMEHVEGINYSYLHTNKILKPQDIDSLLVALKDIHTSTPENFDNIYLNYCTKMEKRFLDYKQLYVKYGIEDLYENIYRYLVRYEINNAGRLGIIHGDPVFTNVLQTKYGIKFIDMRGKQGENCTINGDIMYDYAKVYQSIIGYDYILNGVEIDYLYIDTLKNHFQSYFTQVEINDIKVITASLLITLLPLHDDDENKFKKYIKLIKTLI